jgi:hypothetical protein
VRFLDWLAAQGTILRFPMMLNASGVTLLSSSFGETPRGPEHDAYKPVIPVGKRPDLHSGTPEFESVEIDQTTNMLTVWAGFPNPDSVLVPDLKVGVTSRVAALGQAVAAVGSISPATAAPQ